MILVNKANRMTIQISFIRVLFNGFGVGLGVETSIANLDDGNDRRPYSEPPKRDCCLTVIGVRVILTCYPSDYRTRNFDGTSVKTK